MARPEEREERYERPVEERREPRVVEPAARRVSGAAVVSTILGVLGLIASLINVGGVIGPVIGVVLGAFAILLGAVGVGQIIAGTRLGITWAVIGLVLGAVALTFGILAAVFGIFVVSIRLVT